MSARGFLREVYRRDPVLALTGWAMLALFAALLAVAPFDARRVTGLNPWVKPLKFCLSVAAYVWTLAWLLGHLRARPRRTGRVLRRACGTATSR